jgi:hypothetical protein
MTVYKTRYCRLLMLSAIIAGPRLTAASSATDFCALTVDFMDHQGRPARLTPVQLMDPSGKVVFDKQVEGPSMRICDFGFGAHQLLVGYSFCYPVRISGLRLVLGNPIHLTVRLNKCPPDTWYGKVCRTYLRVRDQAGAHVQGVRVLWGTHERPGVTDGFGRVESYLLEGTFTQATLSKEGYLPETVSLACPESGEIEKEVVLQRAPH